MASINNKLALRYWWGVVQLNRQECQGKMCFIVCIKSLMSAGSVTPWPSGCEHNLCSTVHDQPGRLLRLCMVVWLNVKTIDKIPGWWWSAPWSRRTEWCRENWQKKKPKPSVWDTKWYRCLYDTWGNRNQYIPSYWAWAPVCASCIHAVISHFSGMLMCGVNRYIRKACTKLFKHYCLRRRFFFFGRGGGEKKREID